MDKFTLFELHVHDGMEFSATNTAPAIGRSDEAESEEYVDAAEGGEMETETDTDEPDTSGGSSRLRSLLVGVVFLAVVAVAVRKLRGGGADLEIAELDDLTDDEGPYDEADVES
jgi:hypothetical protein